MVNNTSIDLSNKINSEEKSHPMNIKEILKAYLPNEKVDAIYRYIKGT